jgi:uncharacterized protein YkwD/subtilisin-like proprotein convertase family protein
VTWTRPRTAVLFVVAGAALALASPALADTATFSDNSDTTIRIEGNASPYPATIEASGMAGNLTGATATLKMVDAANMSKLDILLVSPTGKTVMLLSDVGGNAAQANMTFDDAAPGPYPGGAVGTAGTYKPTDIDPSGNSDAFNAPAPGEPYGATMSALNGGSPNGTWKLYVETNDGLSNPEPIGAIHGWSLTLTSAIPPPPPEPMPVEPTPPPPAPPVDPTAPEIKSATFNSPPVAGQDTTLTVVARDPDSQVTGIIVDFGEPLGLWAESACIKGAPNTGGTVSFDVPYRYLGPGDHTVTLTVLSGGCGAAQATQQTFTVTVRGAGSARAHRADDTVPPTSPDTPTTPTPAKPGQCADANTDPTAANSKLVIAALLCVMNQQRAKLKLKPLVLSARLGKAALAHSRAMVAGRFFAHQGPREAALGARLRKVKYTGSGGENIGAGGGPLGTAAGMVNGWMHSKLHKANLLNPRWRAVGIGFLPQFPLRTPARPVATYTTDFGLGA